MNILITGASRGIGKAIAIAAATAGHTVALVSRSAEAIESVISEIAATGKSAHGFVCDVTSSKEVEKLHREVLAKLSSIDAVVNNAGVAPSLKLEDTTDEIWERTFATNVCSTFFISRTFLSELRKSDSAHIVNIASTAALEGFAYTTAYTASKHAVLGLSRALAKELFKAKIAVATVCPGFVRTSILDTSIQNIIQKTGKSAAEAEAQLGAMNKTGKIIEPEEVAAAVLNALSLPPESNGYEIIL